jgi:hypothetical protein
MSLKKLRYICFLILVSGISISSCGKNDSVKDITNGKESETQEPEDTVQLTPAELFTNAMCDNFLKETDDEDLQIYLEEEIFPLVSKSDKVTIEKLSASLYLLSYKDGNESKNILIQKNYNPQNDEIFFLKEVVTFDAKNYYIE